MRRFVLALALFSAGCGNASATVDAVRAMGFTSVTATGWSPFSCSDSDWWCTGFEAINSAGRPVTGVVGCGLLFKGCTVRVK